MIEINCDMGEGFGIYKLGNDQEIMPYITQANIACGFHGSDPNHMRRTVQLAKQHGVKVGAHFSYPDMQGFGRRVMAMSVNELENMLLYQIGALKGFLDYEGLKLNHLKPHGALYGVCAKNSDYASCVARLGSFYQVPVFGLSGSEQEKACHDLGVAFEPEFFSDLDYDGDGQLLITTTHDEIAAQSAADRSLKAVIQGKVKSTAGHDVDVIGKTICIHSDTPNAVDVARATYELFSKENLLNAIK